MRLMEWLPELEEKFGQPGWKERYGRYCILSIGHGCGRKEGRLDHRHPLEGISGYVDLGSA